MSLLASWGTAIAFLGVVIITCVKFATLSPEQRRRFKIWFIILIILIGGGTLMQLSAAYL